MKEDFAAAMAALRRERGLSQRKVAADLGISQAQLSHYENGAREPGLNFVCRACDYYGVSADYLLCRSERANPMQEVAGAAEKVLDNMQQLIDTARQGIKQLSTEEDMK